jgi:hypothetical protein
LAVSVPLLGKDIPTNTLSMALVAQNLTTRAQSLKPSFCAENVDRIHIFNASSAKPKDVSTVPPLQTHPSTSTPLL